MSVTLTIRIDDELKNRLDQLANATNRSKSFLAAEAIHDFIELNEWQIKEIKDSLLEAETGDFADDNEVEKTFRKWGVNAA